MILLRLRSDDVYNQTRVYPAPEHRSFALAQQASMLYVLLFFSPATLHEAKSTMREIVDKHFCDNWVVPVYMGLLVDLSVEWDRYKAARDALHIDTLQVTGGGGCLSESLYSFLPPHTLTPNTLPLPADRERALPRRAPPRRHGRRVQGPRPPAHRGRAQ